MKTPCKCHNKNMTFEISDKLRPPSTKNKVKFRKFLDDCPIFVNMVKDHQREQFLELLRKVKYFNKAINDREWTNISK
jgi:hypothetical protein